MAPAIHFRVNGRCPRCGKPVRLATIEPHPTRNDVALHNYECADCGPVRTKIIPLRNEKEP